MKVNGVPVGLVIRENKSIMLKSRPTKAYINLQALINNYQTLQRHAGNSMTLLPVIKANAYGHGSVEVAAALENRGGFFCGGHGGGSRSGQERWD